MDPTPGFNDVRCDLRTRPTWLLRSEDRSGRNDFRMGKEGCGFDLAWTEAG